MTIETRTVTDTGHDTIPANGHNLDIKKLKKNFPRLARAFDNGKDTIKSLKPRKIKERFLEPGPKELEYVTPEQAVGIIKPGESIWVQMAAMTPYETVEAFHQRLRKEKSLTGIKLFALHLEGPFDIADDPEVTEQVTVAAYFMAKNARRKKNVEPVPGNLGAIPRHIRQKSPEITTVIIQVSPPDEYGNCSMGISAEATATAVKEAIKSKENGQGKPMKIIAQVNDRVPVTYGEDVTVNSRYFDAAVKISREMEAHERPVITYVETRIAKHVAELLQDDSTLQFGIGRQSAADTQAIIAKGLKNLRIFAEMISDDAVDLHKAGCLEEGWPITATFGLGTRGMYEYINGKRIFRFRGADYTNSSEQIRKQRRIASMNSAISADLTGQVNADSIGESMHSGEGGADDFHRNAADAHDGEGKGIIRLGSEAWIKDRDLSDRVPVSTIVPVLKMGAGVTELRSSTQYIVTDWGTAFLQGKTNRERAEALIRIAHPRHRAKLIEDAVKIYGKNMKFRNTVINEFKTDTAKWNDLERVARLKHRMTSYQLHKSGKANEVCEQWEEWKAAAAEDATAQEEAQPENIIFYNPFNPLFALNSAMGRAMTGVLFNYPTNSDDQRAQASH